MTTGKTDDQSRIDDLEARIAHQDQALHELSDEVYRQQQQIRQLEAVIRELISRLESAEPGEASSGPNDEIPPHY